MLTVLVEKRYSSLASYPWGRLLNLTRYKLCFGIVICATPLSSVTAEPIITSALSQTVTYTPLTGRLLIFSRTVAWKTTLLPVVVAVAVVEEGVVTETEVLLGDDIDEGIAVTVVWMVFVVEVAVLCGLLVVTASVELPMVV